jgi:hypothetical protein
MPRKQFSFRRVTVNNVGVRYFAHEGTAVFVATDIARALGYNMTNETPAHIAVTWRGRPGHLLAQTHVPTRVEMRYGGGIHKGRHVMTTPAVVYAIGQSRRIPKEVKSDWVGRFEEIASQCQAEINAEEIGQFLSIPF